MDGLHEQVLEALGLAIVSGEISAGHVVRIEELEKRYGVSRPIVREALRVLESKGLVESRRRVGVTILPRTEWNPMDPRVIRWQLAGPDRLAKLEALSELRAGVEPAAAALASERATPEQCGALTQAVIGMAVTARAGDLDGYLVHDVAFHRTLLAASGNEMFASFAEVVEEVLCARTRHALMPTTPNPDAVVLHRRVAEAIQSGSAWEARDAMVAILLEAAAGVREIASA